MLCVFLEPSCKFLFQPGREFLFQSNRDTRIKTEITGIVVRGRRRELREKYKSKLRKL